MQDADFQFEDICHASRVSKIHLLSVLIFHLTIWGADQ